MKINLFLLCSVFIISFPVFAQESESYSLIATPIFAQTDTQNNNTDNVDFSITNTQKTQHYRHELGFSASLISGYGISYQHNFDTYNSLKTTFFAYSSQYNDEDSDINAIFGLEYKRNFHVSRTMKVYGLVGGFFNYAEDYYNYSYGYNKSYYFSNDWNVGAGLGCAFALKRIVLNVDIGFRYFYSLERDFYNDYDYDNDEYFPTVNRSKYKLFNIAVGAGIAYLF